MSTVVRQLSTLLSNGMYINESLDAHSAVNALVSQLDQRLTRMERLPCPSVSGCSVLLIHFVL